MDKGAHFYRCDLQVHSPRDRQWSGQAGASDAERELYARKLIQACRQARLDAVAITDHNDLLFAKFIREAARSERDGDGNPVPPERQIVVFPGIELTLNVPCQAIVLFDASLPDDLFAHALTALAIQPSPPSETKSAETTRLDHITTLGGLHAELDKHTVLRGRYIVFPNVSEGGGDTLMRRGNASKYAKMPCVGGYLDGSVSQTGIGNRNKFDGKDQAWGSKRIALFQTSDNRSSKHDKLGQDATWVKWAEPTAEALRQACLAQESRVSQTEPQLPNVVIRSLSVSNSLFLGPFELEFNPQYNALIGGRGTGKSTALEYLRWALCDQLPVLTGDEELPNYQLRRRRLVEQTLQVQKATVEVAFTVNGVAHVVRRYSATDDIMLKVGDGNLEPCKESDVRALLPVQAYSQKQLSNVSVRLEELSRFIEAPIRIELDDINRRFERNAVEARQIYSTVIRKRRLQRQIGIDDLQLKSLLEQAEGIRGSLTGLSKADTDILAAKPRYDRAEEAMNDLAGDVERFDEIVAEVTSRLEALPSALDADTTKLPESALIGSFQKEFGRIIRDAKKAAAQLSAIRAQAISNGKLRGELAEVSAKWVAKLKEFNSSYEEATKRASAHHSRLEQLAELEKRIADLRKTIGQARKELAGLGDPERRFVQLRKDWQKIHSDRVAILVRECEGLTKRSNGEIRARLKRGTGLVKVLDAVRKAATGSGLRKDRFDKLTIDLETADDVLGRWTEILSEFEALAAHDPEDGDKALPKCPILKTNGFTAQDLSRLGTSLKEDQWLEIALMAIGDSPVFEFRAREEDYIPFENASAGQQATSLLKALLNQPGPPLIIDQPEEDLDNPVILEVVQQVWRAKSVRQLIFASHNANLVVNGDAELVVWCDHRKRGDHSRGMIAGQGAIDVPDICTAIKTVMEGGETAFKLRRDKYGF